MTLQRTPDGVRGQIQTRGGARTGAGRKVERYRRFAAAEVARLTRFWGPRRAAELVALAEWVNDDARGIEALRDAHFEVSGPSLWARVCDRYRAGRAVTLASKWEGSEVAHELRNRASALLKMVRRGTTGRPPAAPRPRRCRCLQQYGAHLHCHVCPRTWSLVEAKTRAVVLSTGATQHRWLPRVRTSCVVRDKGVLWTANPKRGDVGVLVCRACFRSAVAQLLKPDDPLRKRVLADLPPVPYRLDDVIEGPMLPQLWTGLLLRGPYVSRGSVYLELEGTLDLGSWTQSVNEEFEARTLADARANLRRALTAIERRLIARYNEQLG